jgi:hypothetical protein
MIKCWFSFPSPPDDWELLVQAAEIIFNKLAKTTMEFEMHVNFLLDKLWEQYVRRK